MSAVNKELLIIVPAYNEEESISKTIQEIFSLGDSSLLGCSPTILVVNDCSKDATAPEALKAGAKVVSLPYNLGIGGAVQTGFIFAQRHDFDFAIQVDGDNQHDVSYLKDLILPLINGEADMVIGSRFLPPFIGYRSSFIRRIGIHFFSGLIKYLTKRDITDPTSGFRAYNKKMIMLFSHYYPHDYPEPEAIAVAARYGVTIKEVPVQMRKRVTGSSSIRYFKTLYYMTKVTFAIFLDILKGRKDSS